MIAIRTLRQFWQTPAHRDSEQALRSWYAIARRADWSTPGDIKAQFRNASFIGDNRVVFNIAGNTYRLIARINYPYRIAFIRFVGTHAQYDTIDAERI